MFKAKTKVETTSTGETNAELNKFAYGLTKYDGKWTVVQVAYDLNTGTAKVSEVKPEDDRQLAQETFKLDVVKYVFDKENQ